MLQKVFNANKFVTFRVKFQNQLRNLKPGGEGEWEGREKVTKDSTIVCWAKKLKKALRRAEHRKYQ